MTKKLKDVVKMNPEPARGKLVDPSDPWAIKANIAEASLLHRYLLARGINPKFVSKDTKISHAKSLQFQKWKLNHQTEEVELDETMTAQHSPYELRQHALKKAQHMHKVKPSGVVANGLHKEETDKTDTITVDIPLMIRLLEYAREDAKTDMDLHSVTERLIEIRGKGMLTMADYDYVVTGKHKVKEGFDNYDEIAKELIKRHGKNVTKDHVKAIENERDSRAALDHDAVMAKVRAMGSMTEAKKPKPTALDKFRKAAAEREKKHAEIEKKSGGMTAAIDRLEKHVNKEETDGNWLHPNKVTIRARKDSSQQKTSDHDSYYKFIAGKAKLGRELTKKEKDFVSSYKLLKQEEVEQIDELKKSTVKSWLSQQPVVPPKKPGMDRKAHNQRIKTRSKSWDSAIDRLTGRKPTSEDVYHDTYAATQMPFDGANNTNDTSLKREMSKSARIIKSIYKRKNMKEETYDWEKDDKAQQPSLGKKQPKIMKTDEKESYGENKPEARIVMSGGTTLTGEPRDMVEIDPNMKNRPGPDAFEKSGKKSPNV
jgi:hypothetical protein